MAKRKGKSRQRIRNWQQRLHDGGDVDDTAPERAKLTRRSVKLPPSREETPEENLEGLPKIEGMVVGHFPGGVVAQVGEEQLLCGVAKTFRAPEGSTALAVGDSVTVALTRSQHAGGQVTDDRDRSDGMVLARGPRETALSRPAPRSQKRRDRYDTDVFEKVIVANVEVLLIVAASREPVLRRGLIDRYLIIADHGELTPLLAINKVDLGEPDWQVLSDFVDVGLEIFLCSAATGDGLGELADALAGKRSVLAGASGVGKSTLINAMIPGADAATAEIRMKDQRGRHTTSAAVTYALPDGGMIVDTPGVREMGIHMDAADLPWYFPEFEQLGPDCKFRNCTHTHEPDCAIQAAVGAGEILLRRYESYLRILDTLDDS